MTCDKCNKNIPEQLDYCPTCKAKENLSNPYILKQEQKQTKHTTKNLERELISQPETSKELTEAEIKERYVSNSFWCAGIALFLLMFTQYVIIFFIPVIIWLTISGITSGEKALSGETKGIARLGVISNIILLIMSVCVIIWYFIRTLI